MKTFKGELLKILAWGLFGGAVSFILASNYLPAAERAQVRPAYGYGKSRSFDQQNSGNAHYQQNRPADSYRSTIERTQNSRSVESQRTQQKQLNYENRNSYQKGKNK